MTKISELGTVGNIGANDQFVCVQNGTTYNTTANTLATFVNSNAAGSGDGGTPRRDQTALPLLTEDIAYGTVGAVSIDDPGTNFPDALDGQVLCCAHHALVYNPGIGYESEDATKYLARGLQVLVSVSSGRVTSVDIVNPGQLYRKGDILEITLIKSIYSGGGQENVPTGYVPARVKVTEVQPFMIGYANTGWFWHMGSSNPWVQRLAGISQATSWGSTSTKNPQIAGNPNLAGGEFFVQEGDWNSSLYVYHDAGTAENITAYSHNNYPDGYTTLYQQGNTSVCVLGPHRHWSNTLQIDVALPGSWIPGSLGITASAAFNLTDETKWAGGISAEYPNEDDQYIWPTKAMWFPEISSKGKSYGGTTAFYDHGTGAGLSANAQRGAFMKILHAKTALRNTKSQINANISANVEAGVTGPYSEAKFGVYNPTQTNIGGDAEADRGKNPSINSTMYVPYYWGSALTQMVGFYLFEPKDVLQELV